MALAIKGTIVPLKKSSPKQTFKGRVYLTDDGRIAVARKLAEAAPTGFAGVTEVDVGETEIELRLETRGKSHVEEITASLRERGFRLK
jgi:hypothetical protein